MSLLSWPILCNFGYLGTLTIEWSQQEDGRTVTKPENSYGIKIIESKCTCRDYWNIVFTQVTQKGYMSKGGEHDPCQRERVLKQEEWLKIRILHIHGYSFVNAWKVWQFQTVQVK